MKAILLFLAMIMFDGPVPAQTIPNSYEEYKATIAKIRHYVVDLTSSSDLFGATNFIALYEHPVFCISNAYLKDKSNSEQNCMIVVYSMQKLPLDDYVAFESKLVEMAKKHEIQSTLLNRSLFPGIEWSTKLQREFRYPPVKAFLEMLRQLDFVSDANKGYASEILSGKAEKDIEDLQGNQ